MEFCDQCENMLYVRSNGQNVIHECNFCHKEFDIFKSKTTCISKKSLNKSDNLQTPCINKHVFTDPTLPVVSNIACTNKSCTKPEKEPNKVVYIRYDTSNMKYLYHCRHCQETWSLKA